MPASPTANWSIKFGSTQLAVCCDSRKITSKMLQGLLVIRMPAILIEPFSDGLVYRRVNTSDSRPLAAKSCEVNSRLALNEQTIICVGALMSQSEVLLIDVAFIDETQCLMLDCACPILL